MEGSIDAIAHKVKAGGTIVVELEGKPVAKGRPRFGQGRTYTPAKTSDYEAALAWQAKRAMRGREILTGAVSISVVAGVEIPLSWSGSKKAKALAGTIWPISRPDLDNYEKIAADALNRVVFLDDAQIVFSMSSKVYAAVPFLRIEIADLERATA